MGRIKHSAAWWCYVRGEITPERFVRAASSLTGSGFSASRWGRPSARRFAFCQVAHAGTRF